MTEYGIMRALSVKQPWAWLIVNGLKDIENRTWSTAFKGMILIHASKTMDEYNPIESIVKNFKAPEIDVQKAAVEMYRGGIVGIARITGCVAASESKWFEGPYGYTLDNARPFPFVACNGNLGFWTPSKTILAKLPMDYDLLFPMEQEGALNG